MRMMLPVFGALAFTCASAAVNAQSSWTNLNGLNAGQKIQVIETNSKKHSGTFLSLSDTAISFKESNSERSIQKQDVRSVKLRTQRRLRNALIGAGVGGASGAALGAATTPSDGLFGGKGFGAAFVGTGFAFVGAGVGAVLPTHNTIYTVDSRR